MAIFDPHDQRLCVRIVYDGVAGAGKTTNLRQLAALFAAQRATEVFSPSEVDGRTLYFDWLQIPAGVVAGIPLLCQIISVPGQVVLTPRRRHLLSTADIVVYVCDSAEGALPRAREAMGVFDSVAEQRGEPIPLLIQANKQDQGDALDGARLVAALERTGTPFVDAIATEGIGVVDTFVSAVRTLSRSMQARAERNALHFEVRRAETREAALARLEGETLDPEWAAEMLLEEASAAFLVAELEARAGAGPTPSRAVAARSGAAPPLPHADVPTGYIWPAHTGRSALRSLAGAGALHAQAAWDAEGSVCHRAGGYVLRTGVKRRFENAEAAQQALVRSARERTQLEHLLVPDTVVVAHSSDDGAWWLWTVMPEIPSLADALAEQAADEAAARALLDAYGVALVDAVRTTLRHGFGLDVSPSAFGVQGHALRYVADMRSAPSVDGLASEIADAVTSLEETGADVSVVLAAFERDLARKLTREERARTNPSDAPVGERSASPSAAARVHAMLTRAAEA